MGAHSSMLHVRIDDEVKAKATAALEAMGLSTSDAVRLLFHRIAADQAFPLELKVQNAETRAAMAEAAEIVRSRKLRIRNAAELFAVLDEPGTSKWVGDASTTELDRVTIDPNQCGGRPCLRGLRIRVKDVLDLLAAGASREEILEDYPLLEAGDVTAALEYAARQNDHPVLRVA